MWRSWRSALPILGLFWLIVFSLYFMGYAAQKSDRFGEFYIWLLGFNVVMLLVLAVIIAWRVVALLRDLLVGAEGSRLAARLILMFVFTAVVPVFIVWAFSVRFLSSGLDRWFDVDIQQTLNNALELSQRSFDFQKQVRLEQTSEVLHELQGQPDAMVSVVLDRYLDRLGALDLTLLAPNQRIVATSSRTTEFRVPELPSQQMLVYLAHNDHYVGLEPQGAGGMHIRVIVREQTVDPGVQPRTLVAVFSVSARMGELAEAVENAHARYQQLAFLNRPLKQSFRITLSLVLLLTTLFSVWAAFFMTRKLLAPIKELVRATKSVSEGNYRQRLPVIHHDELGFLVESFNAMTAKIQRAQESAELSQRLVESQRSYLQAVLDHLSSGVLTLDENLRIRTANEAANQILEMDKPLASFTGQHIAEIAQLRPVLQAFYDQLIPELLRLAPDWTKEVTLFGDSGRKVLICRGVELPGQQEQHGGYAIVIDDVTSLIKAQRDAAWGEVARRLAHEIKNPLTPIQLSAERLEHRLSSALPPKLQEILSRSIQTIVNQVEAMKGMVNTFRDYASPPPAKKQSMSINALIREVTDLYGGYDQAVEFDLRLAQDLPEILGDKARLRQVLHNLIKNAVEANAGDGQGKHRVMLETNFHDSAQGRYIELRVADNGPGISESLLDRIFEPYVTDKAKGTGLGLAIAKRIVEEHGGVISASNRPEGGAQFVIRLPYTEESPQA